MKLTKMQRRYIWLMGAYPNAVAIQGRGIRGGDALGRLLYALNDDEDQLYLFGYSDPLYHLKQRGLVTQLQDGRSFSLSEDGELLFRQLLVSQAGIKLNGETKRAKLK